MSLPAYWGNQGEWNREAKRQVDPLLAYFAQQDATLSTYGVVGDGVTDDTAALQRAINDGHAGILPPVIKFGALTIPAGCRIVGAPTIVTMAAGSYDTFTIQGSGAIVDRVQLNCAAKTGGYEFHIQCGSSVIERTRIRDVTTFNARGGIKDSGSTGYHVTTILDHVQFRGHNGPGLAWNYGFAFLELSWTAVDFVTVPTSNYTGFYVNFGGLPAGAGGIEFHQCDVLGTAGDLTNPALPYNAVTNPYLAFPNQRGFVVENGGAIWFNKTRADTLGDKGYVLNNVFAVTFDAQANLCAGTGAELTTVANSEGTISVQARKGLAYAPANVDGIKLVSGCFGINLSGGIVRDCTGHGINKSAAQAGMVTFTSYHATDNTGRGVKSTGNSSFYYQGALVNNTAGNYDLGGTIDYLMATPLNSGIPTAAGPGPVTG